MGEGSSSFRYAPVHNEAECVREKRIAAIRGLFYFLSREEAIKMLEVVSEAEERRAKSIVVLAALTKAAIEAKAIGVATEDVRIALRPYYHV